MFQQKLLIGRLTRDPESKPAGKGTVCKFTVAVDEGFGDKKSTEFFNVAAWDKLGENVQKFLKTGSMVMVLGKEKSSKRESVTYWEWRADIVKFLDTRSANPGTKTLEGSNNTLNDDFFADMAPPSDDDLPF